MSRSAKRAKYTHPLKEELTKTRMMYEQAAAELASTCKKHEDIVAELAIMRKSHYDVIKELDETKSKWNKEKEQFGLELEVLNKKLMGEKQHLLEIESQLADTERKLELERQRVKEHYKVYAFAELTKYPSLRSVTGGDAVLQFIEEELDKLVGQDTVKEEVRTFYCKLMIRQIKKTRLNLPGSGSGSISDLKREQPKPLTDPWRINLEINHTVWAHDRRDWYRAVVKEAFISQVFITYVGFATRFDEWIDRSSPRLQCFDEKREDTHKKPFGNPEETFAASATAAQHSDDDDFPGHMLLVGPPGTGKTTIAGIIQRVLLKLGLVNANYVQTNGNDLSAEFVGQTKEKVHKLFEKARGGVLLIDETYGVLHTKGNYGDEAVAAILQHLSPPPPKRPTCVVLMAGYEKPMNNFLKMNDGISRRIQQRLSFKSYTLTNLRDMFLRLLKQNAEELVADPDLNDAKQTRIATGSNTGASSATAAATALATKDDLPALIVDDMLRGITPQVVEKENAALASRLFIEAETSRAQRLAKHLSFVRQDTALVNRFTRVDFIHAAEAVNRYYAQAATD